jgi:hypothetical protein
MTSNGSLISCAGANGETGGQLVLVSAHRLLSGRPVRVRGDVFEGIACALTVSIE